MEETQVADIEAPAHQEGTNSSPTAAKSPRVAVRDNEIVLNAFHETDPEVVELARKAKDGDSETAIHSALQIGARAIKLARVSVDTMVVESAFDGMTTAFDQKLEEVLSDFSQQTDGLLDEEEGALPHALQDFRGQLEALLSEEFDDDSKTSIIGKFDELISTQRDGDREAIRKLLDSGNDESPLYRLQRDLTAQIQNESESLRKLVGEVSEKVAAAAAAGEIMEKTAIKGDSYEDLLHSAIGQLVTPFGDTAERTGTLAGAAGNKRGDEVVTLDVDDTPGTEARYVLEAKDRKLGLQAIFSELAEAMENREAGAAIAVFSSQKRAPSSVPFSYRGDKAIVVLDKDEPDPSALRLATMWARWVVRRKLVEEEREVDTGAIEEQVDNATQALAHYSLIKRHHTTASKSIERAGEAVSELVDEVDQALDRVRAELHP